MSTGLRVTLLTMHYAPEPTGNAPYAASLAESLVLRGHRVRVVAAHPHYPDWQIYRGYGGWRKGETVNGVTIDHLRHYIPKNPSGLRRLAAELSFGLRLLFARWGKPDVVVLASPALLATSVAIMRARWGFRRVPTVVWVQDIYSLGLQETAAAGGTVTSIMKRIESSTLGSATRVVAIHDRFKAFISNGLGVDASRIGVVRNWTHLAAADTSDRGATRARLGWGDDEIVVLHAGNQGAKQGLENVVDAARLADERGEPVRFVLLGRGNQRNRLEAAAEGVDRIQFIDPLPDDEYQAAMSAADILLVNERPGVAEMSVPSKLTSYFSTARPLIAATDAGSVTADEIALSGGGLRVDAADPGALVDEALALGRDRDACERYGAAGRAYRLNALGIERAVDLFEEELTAVAQRTSATTAVA